MLNLYYSRNQIEEVFKTGKKDGDRILHLFNPLAVRK